MSGEAKPGRDPHLLDRVWRSIVGKPIRLQGDRDRVRIVLDTLILHFRPTRVAEPTIRYTHTWGLGGSSLVLALLLTATGALLVFAYRPAPELAHQSIVRLETEVLFGRLVRAVHYWSANLIIVVATLHLLRVYFTGGHRAPRQLNWLIGLGLLGCILASNFTGYLLPWDQLSYWAITIVTGMIGYVPALGASLQQAVRGGEEIGSGTLIGFYALHTTVVPVALVALMALHFWRIRKARGVVMPRRLGNPPQTEPHYVTTVPNLLLRELVAAQMLMAVVLSLAIFVGAPLGEAANPGMSPNPAKAPWYFAGLQEALLHFHPAVGVTLLPLAALVGLAYLPYLEFDTDTSGIWMMSRTGRRTAFVAAVVAAVVTPAWIVLDESLLDFAGWLPGLPRGVTTGVLPAAILLAGVIVFASALKRRYATSSGELAQALFVLFATTLALLTVTGSVFRGPGMALAWPWDR